MSVICCLLKASRTDCWRRINCMKNTVKVCYKSASSHAPQENLKSSRWGYVTQGENSGKKDKQAPGLYHLGTVHLPQELETNLNKYLKNFPSKRLVQDALKLSRHLQNRGRPTEGTWVRYKEAREARRSQENADGKATQDLDKLKLDEDVENTESAPGENINKSQNQHTETQRTKKPKTTEYKVVRYEKRETAAYAADRLPGNYGANLRVLHEISRREEQFQPKTVLDFGSGLGTAIWAAQQIWGDYTKIYQGVDISPVMNEAAQFLLTGGDNLRAPPVIPRVYFKEYLPVSDKLTYDLVIASYSLSEIPFMKTRQAILENLWRKTNEFLVVIERGNNEGFDICMQARNLIAKHENNLEDISMGPGEELNRETVEKERGYVFSPCPHDIICPRSDVSTRDHPCNFEQRVQLSFAQRRTSLKRFGCYNETFSYVVLRKAARSDKELDWPRILRPVRLRKRHVICNFCSKDGSLDQKVLTRRRDNELYKCARHRAKWGDLLPVVDKTEGEEK